MTTLFAIKRDSGMPRLVLQVTHQSYSLGSPLGCYITSCVRQADVAAVWIGDRGLVNRRDWIAEAWARLEAKWGMR